jgi:hypothetical protein
MTIERSGKVNIHIDIKAQQKDAEKLLGTLKSVNKEIETLKRGGFAYQQAFTQGNTFRNPATSFTPTVAEDVTRRPGDYAGYSSHHDMMERLGKAAARATGPLSAAVGWIDKLAESASKLASSPRPGAYAQNLGSQTPSRQAGSSTRWLSWLTGMLPHFADGGIVPGLPGSAQPIVAHGGEAVIPSDVVRQLTGRDRMTRAEFYAEKMASYPTGLSPYAVSNHPDKLYAWRQAVVNHYFTESGEHRGVSERLRMLKQKESAYVALKQAASGEHFAGGGIIGGIKDWAQQRYGVKGAMGAYAAGNAATWAISAGLTAALGVPAILPPGTGLLAGLAIAEARHRLKSPGQLKREKEDEVNAQERERQVIARLGRLPQFGDSGAGHYAGGGFVGADGVRGRVPLYATAGEKIISPGGTVRTVPHVQGVSGDWVRMAANPGDFVKPLHYASGGTVTGPVAGVQDVRVINFQDLILSPLARPGGPSLPGSGGASQAHGRWAEIGQFLGGASRVASAGGAGVASEVASTASMAASAGGPAAIIVAGLTAIGAGMEKSTSAMEIWNNSLLTGAQKQRALAEEFVPGAQKFHRFLDAQGTAAAWAEQALLGGTEPRTR